MTRLRLLWAEEGRRFFQQDAGQVHGVYRYGNFIAYNDEFLYAALKAED